MKMSFMNPDQLAALAAIADTGSFERGAAALGVTTSAASQRIRALERTLGRILIARGSPSTVTSEGAIVLRYAREQQLLAEEMTSELEGSVDSGGSVEGETVRVADLSVAVNADSLATWFPAVFPLAAAWPDVRLRLVADDEGHTADLLRGGTVMAAISTSGAAVAGCRIEPLGTVRYLPRVHPDLLDRHHVSDQRDVTRLPALRFDAKDDLQDAALASAGIPARSVGPTVPGSDGFAAAVGAGLGWGMLPLQHVKRYPALVPVPGLLPLDRRLFWHRWKLASERLDRLSDSVHRAFDTYDPAARP